jgi:hypothetical protein
MIYRGCRSISNKQKQRDREYQICLLNGWESQGVALTIRRLRTLPSGFLVTNSTAALNLSGYGSLLGSPGKACSTFTNFLDLSQDTSQIAKEEVLQSGDHGINTFSKPIAKL